MVNKNLYSLGLLRNGKVYANKQLAIQGLTQTATNDGVAKLARYLDSVTGGGSIIRTLVGFYADANKIEDVGNGQSSYTVLDIDGNAADINRIKQEITTINAIIGNGIQTETLTSAIIDINSRLGSGFTNSHTVADSLEELEQELTKIPDVSGFINSVEYEEDGQNHSIIFYHDNVVIDSIDATPFLVDGMIENVYIEDGYLVIDFNTASGKEDIHIPLSDIFNPNAYYTKDETDAKLLEKENEIYNLTKIVGDMGGAVTYNLPNEASKSFNTLMSNNGTVKLTDDVETGIFGPGIMAKNNVKLNLNTYNLTFTGLTTSSSFPAIMSRGTEEITIYGKGIVDAGQGICIEANGKDSIINLTGSTTVYQTDRPSAELIYCYAGTINIMNGTFKNNGSPYLLNCYDANYKNGTAKIVVTGGKFYDFNPADNTAEGEHTNFLAEGYHVETSIVVEEGIEHTVYTVKKD